MKHRSLVFIILHLASLLAFTATVSAQLGPQQPATPGAPVGPLGAQYPGLDKSKIEEIYKEAAAKLGANFEDNYYITYENPNPFIVGARVGCPRTDEPGNPNHGKYKIEVRPDQLFTGYQDNAPDPQDPDGYGALTEQHEGELLGTAVHELVHGLLSDCEFGCIQNWFNPPLNPADPNPRIQYYALEYYIEFNIRSILCGIAEELCNQIELNCSPPFPPGHFGRVVKLRGLCRMIKRAEEEILTNPMFVYYFCISRRGDLAEVDPTGGGTYVYPPDPPANQNPPCHTFTMPPLPVNPGTNIPPGDTVPDACWYVDGDIQPLPPCGPCEHCCENF